MNDDSQATFRKRYPYLPAKRVLLTLPLPPTIILALKINRCGLQCRY
jgi:hypothetical protein